MSVRSLKNDLDGLHERLLERIADAVETHGLDPDSDEVHEIIEGVFGDSIRAAYENEAT
jgi:hypothetical protein